MTPPRLRSLLGTLAAALALGGAASAQLVSPVTTQSVTLVVQPVKELSLGGPPDAQGRPTSSPVLNLTFDSADFSPGQAVSRPRTTASTALYYAVNVRGTLAVDLSGFPAQLQTLSLRLGNRNFSLYDAARGTAAGVSNTPLVSFAGPASGNFPLTWTATANLRGGPLPAGLITATFTLLQ